jgi:hypothetical protein
VVGHDSVSASWWSVRDARWRSAAGHPPQPCQTGSRAHPRHWAGCMVRGQGRRLLPCCLRSGAPRSRRRAGPHTPSLSGAAANLAKSTKRKTNVAFSVLLTQIDQSDTIPHSAGLISDQPESGPSQSRRSVHASRLLRRVITRESCCPGRPPAHSDGILGWLTAMAFWDGQAGAFKDAGRAGGKRHACPRRGRSACGVGRSGRIEGEVGRRGVLWQEKSWARREVRSPPEYLGHVPMCC